MWLCGGGRAFMWWALTGGDLVSEDTTLEEIEAVSLGSPFDVQHELS